MAKINARVMNGSKVVREVSIDIRMGTTLPELVKQYGEGVVFEKAMDAIVIAAQSAIRTLANPDRKDGRLDDRAIAAKMAEWKPGTRNVTRDPAKKMAATVKTLKNFSPEQLAEILKSAGVTPVAVQKKKAA